MRLMSDKTLSAEKVIFVIREITHILVSCLDTMSAHLGKSFKFSNILIHMYTNFRRVFSWGAFLQSIDTSFPLSILVRLNT